MKWQGEVMPSRAGLYGKAGAKISSQMYGKASEMRVKEMC